MYYCKSQATVLKPLNFFPVLTHDTTKGSIYKKLVHPPFRSIDRFAFFCHAQFGQNHAHSLRTWRQEGPTVVWIWNGVNLGISVPNTVFYVWTFASIHTYPHTFVHRFTQFRLVSNTRKRGWGWPLQSLPPLVCSVKAHIHQHLKWSQPTLTVWRGETNCSSRGLAAASQSGWVVQSMTW